MQCDRSMEYAMYFLLEEDTVEYAESYPSGHSCLRECSRAQSFYGTIFLIGATPDMPQALTAYRSPNE